MADLHVERADADSALKRRKVRKGTHSCWECRRRKIRCQIGSGEEYPCLPCKNAGRVCRSQEFVDSAQPPTQPSERSMTQRLNRLEGMMARLVDRLMPDAGSDSNSGNNNSNGNNNNSSSNNNNSSSSRRSRSAASSPTPTPTADGDDVRQELDVPESPSIVDETPVGLLLGLRNNMAASSSTSAVMMTPESAHGATNGTSSSRPYCPRYEKTCRALYTLYPTRRDVKAIVGASPAAWLLASRFYGFRDLIEGKTEPPLDIANIPPLCSHPSVLARKLVQLCVCMQQVPLSFDLSQLQLKGSLTQVMANIIATVTDLVTTSDELIGTAEGLQTLYYLGYWHTNAGNLRKAWLGFRRALSLAQLIGLDRGSTHALKWADPDFSPTIRARPSSMWYRINYHDRYLSLLLGLPVGSRDDGFASPEAIRRDTHMERLEKLHTVVSGRIIERNRDKTSAAFATTRAIDCDMEAAARDMGSDWWAEPTVENYDTAQPNMGQIVHFFLQLRHFDLLILLHLPYMLRDPAQSCRINYEYSKSTCARASREVLRRFISWRTNVPLASAYRDIDYSALVAAMTLLLSYLHQPNNNGGGGNGNNGNNSGNNNNNDQNNNTRNTTPALPQVQIPGCAQRQEDRRLIEVARERMQHVAIFSRDKLSQESADMIGELMPVLDSVDAIAMGGSVTEMGVNALKCLHLNVPYFGTINIHPNGMAGKAPSADYRASGVGPPAPGVASLGQQTQAAAASQPGMQAVAMPDQTTMDLSALDPSFLPAGMTPTGMFLEFQPPPHDSSLQFPDMVAEGNDWAFQGVDTTYWSLLNSNGLNGVAGGMGPG